MTGMVQAEIGFLMTVAVAPSCLQTKPTRRLQEVLVQCKEAMQIRQCLSLSQALTEAMAFHSQIFFLAGAASR